MLNMRKNVEFSWKLFSHMMLYLFVWSKILHNIFLPRFQSIIERTAVLVSTDRSWLREASHFFSIFRLPIFTFVRNQAWTVTRQLIGRLRVAPRWVATPGATKSNSVAILILRVQLSCIAINEWALVTLHQSLQHPTSSQSSHLVTGIEQLGYGKHNRILVKPRMTLRKWAPVSRS
jgi:hypothetical protein